MKLFWLVALFVFTFLTACASDIKEVHTNHIAIVKEPFFMNWYGDGMVLPLSKLTNADTKYNIFSYNSDYWYCVGLNQDSYKKMYNLKSGNVYKITYQILGRRTGELQYAGANFVLLNCLTIDLETPSFGGR